MITENTQINIIFKKIVKQSTKSNQIVIVILHRLVTSKDTPTFFNRE